MPAWIGPPDGNLGGFGESDGALEARIYLSHLHGSFQANHLEPTVAEICHERLINNLPRYLHLMQSAQYNI